MKAFYRALTFLNMWVTLPETRGWGVPYSKKLGELSLVDSDSTRREKHAYIDHSSR